VRFTPPDEQFRSDVRKWLEANLTSEFAGLRGAGDPARASVLKVLRSPRS